MKNKEKEEVKEITLEQRRLNLFVQKNTTLAQLERINGAIDILNELIQEKDSKNGEQG